MIEKLNYYGKNKIPILFIIDFDIKNPIIIPLDKVDKEEIIYNINGVKNYNYNNNFNKDIYFRKYPITLNNYKKAFIKVKKELVKGNSFLLNLTFPTRIETNLTFKEIFFESIAKYKLLFKDDFVVFSPEQFVVIKNNKVLLVQENNDSPWYLRKKGMWGFPTTTLVDKNPEKHCLISLIRETNLEGDNPKFNKVMFHSALPS